ncbi:MAG: HNH endonuclease [Candidatus Lokiarchaeia archaeon]
MLKSSIPRSVQQIFDVFIKTSFSPRTYKTLAKFLKIDTNTLVQRINRNSNYFMLEGERPRIIKLNKNCNEIFFYRDKNKCQICQNMFEPDELIVRYKDPLIKEDKDAWENIITCCSHCKDKDLTKILRKKKETAPNGNIVWEYKEIGIREVQKRINSSIESVLSGGKYENEDYWEFNEYNGQGWFRLHDEENNTCIYVNDILNYFGSHGWDLVNIKEYYYYESDIPQGYHCFFKRIKNGGNGNDKAK